MLTSVLNVSALRAARSLAIDQPLYLQGYYTPGDGGEGMFLHNSSDTTSDDKGTIIPDGDGNRWYRQTEGRPYSIKWFGAKGDGTTNDRSAIQEAIVTVQRLPFGGTVWFPAGNYRINESLDLTAPVTLLGAGNKTINGATRIVPTSMDFHVIRALNVNYGIVIRGIDIGGLSPPAQGFGGAAIYLYQCQRVDIEDVNVYHLWNGVLNDSSGDVYLRRVSINLAAVPFQGSRYRFGVLCTAQNKDTPPFGNPNSTQCDSVVVGQGLPGGTAHGFVLANGYNSLTLLNCGALGCAFGRWVTSDGGVPPAFFVETSGTTDHCRTGWAIDAGGPGGNIQLNNCLCTSSFNENYYVNSTYGGDVQFTGCRAIKTGSPTSAGHGAGFSLNGSGNYSLAGCSAYSTGGHNVAISGAAMVSITGGVFSHAGKSANPDKDSFHIYANARGSLAISGVNQHNASRGMFDDGSTCVIHGHVLFLVNFITAIDISRNHSSPPSSVWHP